MSEIAPGAFLHRGFLDEPAQKSLARDVEAVIAKAPLFIPRMPGSGKPFSVRMTNCGSLGWVSDRARGYRYEPRHPASGEPWPAMPRSLLEAWKELTNYRSLPEACLVNFYGPKARMGLHQDRDEEDLEAPLVSLSLGASCRFRLGGARRADPTTSLVLNSGDALVLSGPARSLYHGVDRILPQAAASTPYLLAGGARINLTLRRVTQ